MPGVFTFHIEQSAHHGAEVAQALVNDMSVYPWQKGRYWEVDSGRVYLGQVINSHMGGHLEHYGCQMGSVTCVVDGHIVKSLEDCNIGALLAGQEYAEAAIQAYNKYGPNFAAKLEGQFTIILYDDEANMMIVASDRHGLAPVFRWNTEERWAYCSLLGPLAASGLFDPEIDKESVGTLLKYNHLFCRQTIIEGVELYDPATITTHNLKHQTKETKRYWHYGHMGGKSFDPSYNCQIDNICDALITATDNLTQRSGPYSIGLSGGMDSRLVAGLARDKAEEFFSWTFGTPDSTDVRIARILGKKLGIAHEHFPVELEATAEHASDFVTITNGCKSVLDASHLKRCHALLGRSNVHLNGYRGGLILGDTVMDIGAPQALKYARYRCGSYSRVSHPWLDNLKTDEEIALFYRDVGANPSFAASSLVPDTDFDVETKVIETLGTVMADVPAEYKLEQFTEEFGGGRHATLLGILHDRHFYGDASVFYDYSVRDLCQSLPARWRRNRKAYLTVFKRLIPDLAPVEYANTGLSALAPAWRVTAAKLFRKLAKNEIRLSLGADIQEWSRDAAVSEFLGDILSDKKTISRKWWDGSQVTALATDHWTGKINVANELGIVAAVELFARRWLDNTQARMT